MSSDKRFRHHVTDKGQAERITEQPPPCADPSLRPAIGTRERKSFEFSLLYRSAWKKCIALQAVFFLMTALMLDFGRMNKLCTVVIVSQLIINLIITGRRPLNPTKGDLLFISYGIVPLMFAAPYLAEWVWDVVGRSSQSVLDRWLSLPPR